MISKVKIKYLRSLKLKKNRAKYRRFIIENLKILEELVVENPHLLVSLYYTEEIRLAFSSHLEDFLAKARVPTESISTATNKKISHLKTPSGIVAECTFLPDRKLPDFQESPLWVYLDDVRDPGNLGTIMRSCDWFGVDLLCISPQSVEVYNPKVIQASMGSFWRVPFIIADLDMIVRPDRILTVAAMEGKPLKTYKWPDKVILAFGSESHGLSQAILHQSDESITISKTSDSPVESLNVSIALAITLSHYEVKR